MMWLTLTGRLALEVEAGVAGGQRGGGHDGDLLAALDLVAAVVVGLDEDRVGMSWTWA